MRAPHVHSPDILEPDLHDLSVPPPLVYPVHDPLRDARLSHLEPLPHPDPDPLQPPELVPRQRELRRGRRHRRRPRRIPPAPPPPPPRRGAGLSVGRGPARVEGGADAVARELGRGGHEDLTGRWGIPARDRRRSGGLGTGLEVAEAAELVRDAAERGLAEELRRGGRGGGGDDRLEAGAGLGGGGGGEGEEKRGRVRGEGEEHLFAWEW